MLSLRTLPAVLLSAALLPSAFGLDPGPADSLLQHGHADQALALLNQRLASNTGDAAALNLACRVYFSEDDWANAQSRCEQAVSLAPNSSEDHLWLGRVLGREAEHASPFTAFRLARQVRAQFETAHQLDPRNTDAISDLAEYYVDAPSLLGGGHDKALALADSVASWDPGLAHSIRGEEAMDRKDAETAERELRAAAETPGSAAETWVALASFYRKQGSTPQMLAAIDRAVAADSAHDDALVSAAEQLTRSHQRPDQAISLLRTYLSSASQSENAPAFRVHAQLARLLSSAGDQQEADRHMAEAHQLASQWHPDMQGKRS